MADETVPTTTAEDNDAANALMQAMASVIRTASAPEIAEAQALLLRRLATEGDVVPARIPAPINITEIGGYINLLRSEGRPNMEEQMLAAALGVAGPTALGTMTGQPPLFWASRLNDRAAATPALEATMPVEITLRSDFGGAFDAARKALHNAGCLMPVLSPTRVLPRALPGTAQDAPLDHLALCGRTLGLAPTAALTDPDADPLAIARAKAGDPLQVVARVMDAGAPGAAGVAAAAWMAITCTAAACTVDTDNRTYLPLAPILNAAGWYQSAAPTAPTSLTQPGDWARWTNITGLVAGRSTLDQELRLLYTDSEIAASSLRDDLAKVWNGTGFAAE